MFQDDIFACEDFRRFTKTYNESVALSCVNEIILVASCKKLVLPYSTPNRLVLDDIIRDGDNFVAYGSIVVTLPYSPQFTKVFVFVQFVVEYKNDEIIVTQFQEHSMESLAYPKKVSVADIRSIGAPQQSLHEKLHTRYDNYDKEISISVSKPLLEVSTGISFAEATVCLPSNMNLMTEQHFDNRNGYKPFF